MDESVHNGGHRVKRHPAAFLVLFSLALLLCVSGCSQDNFTPSDGSDTAGPLISEVGVLDTSDTGATIGWTTDEPATSEVEYGTTSGYGLLSALDGSLVTTHTVKLTGLAAGTTYHYRVKSVDVSGNQASSDDRTLCTLSPRSAVDIVSHSSYLHPFGWYCIVGEVVNNDAGNRDSVGLTVTFYDSFNAVVLTEPTSTLIDILTPNQKSPFACTVSDVAASARIDHYSVEVTGSRTTQAEPYRAFTFTSQSASMDSLGDYHMECVVQNSGTQSATDVRVVGTFYDATGSVVAVSYSAWDRPLDLDVNQAGRFELFVGKPQSDMISSYDLHAVC